MIVFSVNDHLVHISNGRPEDMYSMNKRVKVNEIFITNITKPTGNQTRHPQWGQDVSHVNVLPKIVAAQNDHLLPISNIDQVFLSQ